MSDSVGAAPPVVSLPEWEAALSELREREKQHTREGDAIAAARRRPQSEPYAWQRRHDEYGD